MSRDARLAVAGGRDPSGDGCEMLSACFPSTAVMLCLLRPPLPGSVRASFSHAGARA